MHLNLKDIKSYCIIFQMSCVEKRIAILSLPGSNPYAKSQKKNAIGEACFVNGVTRFGLALWSVNAVDTIVRQ
jgi:hypothetical protein